MQLFEHSWFSLKFYSIAAMIGTMKLLRLVWVPVIYDGHLKWQLWEKKKAQLLWKLLNCVFIVEGQRNLRLSTFYEVFAMEQGSQINIIVLCEPVIVNIIHRTLYWGK